MTLNCKNCCEDFTPTKEQAELWNEGEIERPEYCNECIEDRNGAFGGYGYVSYREYEYTGGADIGL